MQLKAPSAILELLDKIAQGNSERTSASSSTTGLADGDTPAFCSSDFRFYVMPTRLYKNKYNTCSRGSKDIFEFDKYQPQTPKTRNISI